MSSMRLADCDRTLAQAYALGKIAYEIANPGYTVIVTCTHRPESEQFELYKKGRVIRGDLWVIDSDPATGIVTQIDGITKKSKHNSLPSKALDFAVVFNGKVVWNERGEFEEAAGYFKKYGALWGGDWPTFKDLPHLEVD